MAEITTAARPYAKAVFELAQAKGDYETWSGDLQLAAAVVADGTVQEYLASPKLRQDQRAELLLKIVEGKVQDAFGNFIRVLASNDRIPLIPEIARQYEALRAEAEATVNALVVSARDVTDAQKKAISAALAKRLERKVTLQTEVDEKLIGGAVIYAGDLVIDGSIRGRLQKLAGVLTH